LSVQQPKVHPEIRIPSNYKLSQTIFCPYRICQSKSDGKKHTLAVKLSRSRVNSSHIRISFNIFGYTENMFARDT
jgi:hypothetical protein